MVAHETKNIFCIYFSGHFFSRTSFGIKLREKRIENVILERRKKKEKKAH